MRIAIEAAKFTPEEANGLRRAMAMFRHVGTIGKFEVKMVGNMIDRGYDPVFAKNCFEQIKGFGSYGFPESHAASFAQLVYVSSWLKHFHPDAFCCGLLNSQPMGFYAPAQIVGAARKNGVEAREIDVSFSHAQNTLEAQSGKYCAVRLGFRQIDGFKWVDPDEDGLKRIQASFREPEIRSHGDREGTVLPLPLAGRAIACDPEIKPATESDRERSGIEPGTYSLFSFGLSEFSVTCDCPAPAGEARAGALRCDRSATAGSR